MDLTGPAVVLGGASVLARAAAPLPTARSLDAPPAAGAAGPPGGGGRGLGLQELQRLHVNQPALALDLADRLLEREASGDLLLDEQADHLALAPRLDLLADDHLHARLCGLRAGLERARDLVVVRHRDRAQALRARGGEQ